MVCLGLIFNLSNLTLHANILVKVAKYEIYGFFQYININSWSTTRSGQVDQADSSK